MGPPVDGTPPAVGTPVAGRPSTHCRRLDRIPAPEGRCRCERSALVTRRPANPQLTDTGPAGRLLSTLVRHPGGHEGRPARVTGPNADPGGLWSLPGCGRAATAEWASRCPW